MLNMVVWVISYGNIWVIWSSMLLHTILWLAHSWPLISGAVPCLWRHELGQRDPGGRPRWISPENPGNLGCVKWDTIYIYTEVIYIYISHIYVYIDICIFWLIWVLFDIICYSGHMSTQKLGTSREDASGSGEQGAVPVSSGVRPNSFTRRWWPLT